MVKENYREVEVKWYREDTAEWKVPVYVDIDNVRDYYLTHLVDTDWVPDQYPCLLSPWDTACYVMTNDEGKLVPVYVKQEKVDSGFVVTAVVYTGMDDHDVPLLSVIWETDKEGTIQALPPLPEDRKEQWWWKEAVSTDDRVYSHWILSPNSRQAIIRSMAEEDRHTFNSFEIIDGYAYYIHMTHLAMSFLACRNVGLSDRVERQTRQQRRHGRPAITYKVLNVVPPTKEHAEGRPQEYSTGKALHICRGHFARYTDDAPLFGKYTGLFWRPMHVRGKLSNGVVVKDYAVEA